MELALQALRADTVQPEALEDGSFGIVAVIVIAVAAVAGLPISRQGR